MKMYQLLLMQSEHATTARNAYPSSAYTLEDNITPAYRRGRCLIQPLVVFAAHPSSPLLRPCLKSTPLKDSLLCSPLSLINLASEVASAMRPAYLICWEIPSDEVGGERLDDNHFLQVNS